MPRLLIRTGLKGHQKFDLTKEEVIVGRGEDCDVRLTNTSVSRHHCKFELGFGSATLSDLGSANGTQLNKKKIEGSAILNSGDEIMVGKFQLVFLGDRKQDRFFRGRYTDYLPDYKPEFKGGVEASTFAMTKEALKKLQEEDDLVESARLVLVKDRSRFWFPEARGLTFGGAGMIEVAGWFTWGVVASVGYDGKRHVVSREGWLTGVSVNKKPLEKGRPHPLRNGDRVVIGGTSFRYTYD
ncbi:MAG TPA: FHA domain-containing protein [Myxococcota bacterium]|nr:FHA domain-containing protein [Myxococcota bacterium]